MQAEQRLLLVDEGASVKYGFPRWIPYLLLAVMAAASGGCVVAALGSGPSYGAGVNILFGMQGIAIFVFLAWGFLYTFRYSVQLGSEGVSITGAFRTRTIPLGSIAQVITASAPRSGTDSWLLDKSDAYLAKLDGGLIGFEALLEELGKELRPYQALFYRRDTWGRWKMQVAGDTKWVQSDAPSFARKYDRRLIKILAVGFLLILLAAGFAAWL
jgi:hypothetical protein